MIPIQLRLHQLLLGHVEGGQPAFLVPGSGLADTQRRFEGLVQPGQTVDHVLAGLHIQAGEEVDLPHDGFGDVHFGYIAGDGRIPEIHAQGQHRVGGGYGLGHHGG